tara:strand:+ start:215 stop:454 length:240 start_codon:yes stop_codon:yes gene_type:complete
MKILEDKFNNLKAILQRTMDLFQSEQEKEKVRPVGEVSVRYSSLGEYKRLTGRRFRRTTKEIDLGLSPEEAFQKRQRNS